MLISVFLMSWFVKKKKAYAVHPSFINIGPRLVNDTSMERSSRVKSASKPKNLIFFFSKKVDIEFWLVPKCWNNPIALSMVILH